MREALAAANHDYILTEPAKAKQRTRRARPEAKRRLAGLSPAKMRLLRNVAVGALCVAALGGIAFNALSLQKSRHPAPLFAHAAPAFVAKEPAATEPAAAPPLAASPRPQQAAPPRAEDVPAAKSVVEEKPLAAPAHPTPASASDAAPRDAISDLLLGKPHEPVAAQAQTPTSSPKTVLAVQKALIKLGFVLKADGAMGATTHQAIERYERDHHRASNGELTQAVMRRLSARIGRADQLKKAIMPGMIAFRREFVRTEWKSCNRFSPYIPL